jgi:AcrR family transcriptional regulator
MLDANAARPGPDGAGTSRRELITGAAIRTLAGNGMRGLTHRAVDQAAGLPAGSTSYYFRTRQALLQATVERLAEMSTADLAGFRALARSGAAEALTLSGPGEVRSWAGEIERLAEAIAGVLIRWLTVDRDRVIARYELSLEATRRPELREVLVASGAALRSAAADLLAGIGATNPQAAAGPLVACLDGLIFDQVAGAGEPLTPEVLRTTVAGLLRIARDSTGLTV